MKRGGGGGAGSDLPREPSSADGLSVMVHVLGEHGMVDEAARVSQQEAVAQKRAAALRTGRKARRGGGGGGGGDFHARVAAASHHLLPPLLLRQLPGRSRAVGGLVATTVTGAARSQVACQSVPGVWCSAGGAGVAWRAQWHAHDIAARGPNGRF